MRHLSTEELLLYAANELDDRALRRHVRDCVDCKAALVEVQETFVGAAAAMRASVPAEPAALQAASLARLRANIAVETEKTGGHLTAGELLLSSEMQLPAERAAHLSSCSKCQREAANMSVLLADIEEELRSLIADEPAEIKAAALAALEKRLAAQAKEPAPVEKPVEKKPAKVIAFPAARVRRYSRQYAAVAAAAAAVFVVWAGFQTARQAELSVEQVPPPAPVTAAAAPEPLAVDRPDGLPQAAETVAAVRVERFEPAARSIAAPAREAVSGPVPAPAALGGAPEAAPVVWETRELRTYRPLGAAAAANTLAAEARPAAIRKDADESVIEGLWLLAQTGLWKQNIRPSGNGGTIVFTGSVAGAAESAAVESKLRAAAGGRALTFDLALRDDSRGSVERAVTLERAANRPAGGMVRNSLLAHYRDAARRSFRTPRADLLEAELERYVSDVLRHDSELLAHVHIVASVLSRDDTAELGGSNALKRLIAFHLDGIADREAAIYAKLSEVLPRRYWTYRAQRTGLKGAVEAAEESSALLADALGLDQTLTAIFVSGASTLDARGNERSCGERLARIRSHVTRLRRALR